MKVKEILTINNENSIVRIKDKATDEYINLNVIDFNELRKMDVIELSAVNNDVVIFVDIEDKWQLLTEYEKQVAVLWGEIFSCNSWGFNDETFRWYIDGIDVYSGHYELETKAELCALMESDVKEFLFEELRNGTLKETLEDFDL